MGLGRDGGTIKLVSIALWQTLIEENDGFDAEVSGSRLDILVDAARRHTPEITISQVGAAYDQVADEIELRWMAGVPVDNSARVAQIFRLLGVDVSETVQAEVRTALEASHPTGGLVLRPGAPEALTAISRSHRLVLVSDTWTTPGRHMRAFLDAVGLLGLFDAVYFSDETGLSKVSGDAFTRAHQDAGLPAGACMHVGDLLGVDTAGAQRAGFAGSVWIPVAHHPIVLEEAHRSDRPPDLELADLYELASRFG